MHPNYHKAIINYLGIDFDNPAGARSVEYEVVEVCHMNLNSGKEFDSIWCNVPFFSRLRNMSGITRADLDSLNDKGSSLFRPDGSVTWVVHTMYIQNVAKVLKVVWHPIRGDNNV
jgi:hypothetical protein